MIGFRYTILLFAFLSICIAAPPHPPGDVFSKFKEPPSPPQPGWVYYTHSDNLDEWYKTGRQNRRSFGVLPVVALTAPENGKMVVVEIAKNLPLLSDGQKRYASSYFPKFTSLTFAGQFISLRNVKGKADQFYINVGVPRTIDIKELRWDKDEMVTARMGPQEFDILSNLVKERASLSGIVFVNSPWPLNGMACVGWVYYADSSHWLERSIGIMPVVVIEPPSVGQVVVVEIGKTLSYLKPAEKQHASEYFKDGTVLTFGTSNFVPLNTEDIWINVAKPRIINIAALERNSPRATAQMEGKRFADLEKMTKALPRTNLMTLDELIEDGRKRAQGNNPVD